MTEVPTERVIVVRSDYGLPYSKGLMAQSIMAAGPPPDRAHALAARIERSLHEREDNEIDVEDLRELVEEVLLESEGERLRLLAENETQHVRSLAEHRTVDF